MLVTTGYNFEGYTIVQYFDVISAPIVLGTGFLSSLSSSVADLTGSRSGTYERKLVNSKRDAMSHLKDAARQLGGNAIIGIDIDYTTFGGDVMGVVVSGTAVRIAKEEIKADIVEYSIPSCSYNTNLPFNICDITLRKNLSGSTLLAKLQIKNYFTDNIVTALIVDIELEDVFEKVVNICDIAFMVRSITENMKHNTEFAELEIKNVRLDLLRKAYIVVKKIILNDNGKVIEIDTKQSIKNIEISSLALNKMRQLLGEDVVINLGISEDFWTCYCGAKNNIKTEKCYRCGREISKSKREIITNNDYSSLLYNKMMEEVSLKKSAKEIYEFIMSLDNPNFEELLIKLKNTMSSERLYGNMKDSALLAIEKFYNITKEK